MNVPYEFSIVDKRKAKDFSSVTYSGYKKIDVINQLEKSLLNNDLESSCNWLIELHISGKVDSIWKTVFYILSKNININNPQLPSWLWLKYKRYLQIMNKFNKGYEYESRNNQEIRNLFADVITMLVYSYKSSQLDKLPKINNKDFLQEMMVKKMMSKELYNIKDISDNTCSNELKIGLNEIVNHLKSEKHGKLLDGIAYWYLWIEKIEKFKKKNGVEFKSLEHNIKDVDNKYHKDWRWTIWKIILEKTNYINNNKLTNEVHALYNMYKWKYTTTTCVKKQYLIFFACMFLKENINWYIPIINKYEYRVQACCNINQLYRLKKKEELAIENIDSDDEEYIKEEKVEYQKLNTMVNNKLPIEIKTQKKAKPHKIIVKDNEKERQEALMIEKMELFNNLVFIKKEKNHSKHHDYDKNDDNHYHNNNEEKHKSPKYKHIKIK